MQVTAKSRLQIRLQNILFVVLFLAFIGMLAWLSTRYSYQADWTAGARNTLSPASQTLLKRLKEPVSITAYARETQQLRRQISELVGRYQRYKPDIKLMFVNPDREPQQVRKLGITMDGELLIAYQGRSEKLQEISEQGLTNALQRITRSDKRWLAFLSGHGERNPHGAANHDLGNWVRQLESKGISVQTINLASTPQIPANIQVLAIAGPQAELLPGEVTLIQDYIKRGGNLLWLNDPDIAQAGADAKIAAAVNLRGLQPLAEQLGIEFHKGVIVDPTTQLFGIDRPEFALVTEYMPHPITSNFATLTLFPGASGIDLQTPEGWQGEAFLTTQERTWSETGQLQGEVTLDAGKDQAGPLDIGISLVREAPVTAETKPTAAPAQQRIVITGDGDFLSNTYLGNGGNLDLGLNIINWLSHDDSLIAIRASTAPDTALNLSRTAAFIISLGFLFILPLLLFGAGLVIWLRRRKR